MPATCSTTELPLALYIHWPFCRSKCPYCDFNSHVRDSVEHDKWRNALLAEMKYYAARTGNRQAGSIFFGGGTPSLMQPQTVQAVIDTVAEYWTVTPDIEITLEANPTSVEAAKLKSFRTAGVNRVSLGVQALRDDALRFLGRQHSADEALEAVTLAGELFERTTFDLIYTRPQQTMHEWEQELAEALPYMRGHVSLYQLTIEPGTQFYHRFNSGEFDLPAEEVSAHMYERTQEIMEEAGLPAYEISNHAAAGQESRHNLVYWRGGDYLGIGPGAHGRYVTANGERIATRNIRSPEKWLLQVQEAGNGREEQEEQNARTIAEEYLLMGLRLREGVEQSRLNDIVSKEKWVQLQRVGLLEESSSHLRTTAKGRLLLNQILAELVVV